MLLAKKVAQLNIQLSLRICGGYQYRHDVDTVSREIEDGETSNVVDGDSFSISNFNPYLSGVEIFGSEFRY